MSKDSFFSVSATRLLYKEEALLRQYIHTFVCMMYLYRDSGLEVLTPGDVSKQADAHLAATVAPHVRDEVCSRSKASLVNKTFDTKDVANFCRTLGLSA